MSNYNFTEPNPSRQYIDLNFNFTKHPISDDVTVKKNDEAIKQALKTLVMLNSKEKPFHPEITSGIYDLLFENIEEPGTADRLERRIQSVVDQFEPRVELREIKVQALPDQNTVAVTLYYVIINTLTPSSVDIYLNVPR